MLFFFKISKLSKRIINSKYSAIYIFIVLCSLKVSFTAIKVHHLKKDKGNCSSKTTNGCPFCYLEPSYLKSIKCSPNEAITGLFGNRSCNCWNTMLWVLTISDKLGVGLLNIRKNTLGHQMAYRILIWIKLKAIISLTAHFPTKQKL